MMIKLTVNGEEQSVDATPGMLLLWALRDLLGLKGTKFGCGNALCGACTVHLNGRAIRSCGVPVESADGASVVTIEGLGETAMARVQTAWIDAQVPQCGYCQPGMIMSAAALLAENPDPTDADIDGSITNICRCGTYPRIRRAIHRAAGA